MVTWLLTLNTENIFYNLEAQTAILLYFILLVINC
jgi:hypothetical protein